MTGQCGVCVCVRVCAVNWKSSRQMSKTSTPHDVITSPLLRVHASFITLLLLYYNACVCVYFIVFRAFWVVLGYLLTSHSKSTEYLLTSHSHLSTCCYISTHVRAHAPVRACTSKLRCNERLLDHTHQCLPTRALYACRHLTMATRSSAHQHVLCIYGCTCTVPTVAVRTLRSRAAAVMRTARAAVPMPVPA